MIWEAGKPRLDIALSGTGPPSPGRGTPLQCKRLSAHKKLQLTKLLSESAIDLPHKPIARLALLPSATMMQIMTPSDPAAHFGHLAIELYAPAAALSAGCKSALPASDIPSLETILQLYVQSMSSEHLLASGTVDWDLQPKSKTAEEFLARTVSSDLSSYSSATLSFDSEDAKDDLPERSCGFWDDVGTQTFGLAQELSRSASTSSEAASWCTASSDDSDEENDDTGVLLPWDL